MGNFAVYHPETGELLWTGRCQDGMEALQPGPFNRVLYPIEDPHAYASEVHRVDLGQVPPALVRKGLMGATIDTVNLTTDPASRAIISGIPVGVTARINGVAQSGTIEDGTLEFGADMAGVYTVELTRADLRTQAFVITVITGITIGTATATGSALGEVTPV